MSAFTWMITLPLLASPVVYLAGRISRRRNWDVGMISHWLAFWALAATWIPFALAASDLDKNGPDTFQVGQIALRLDDIGLLLAGLSLGLGTLVVLYSGPYISPDHGREKYHSLLVAMVGVMMGLGCAHDLFNLWVWFEAMAISSFLLVAFYHEQAASLEAGVKYVVQSAVGSALVLMGIALVLAQTGTLDLDKIRLAADDSNMLLAAGALFVIGFGVKTAMVPMHTWLPDAHSQAPSGISAMLSGVVIEAGLIALLRSLSALAGVTPTWGELLMAFGVLNMTVGNLMALRQTQVKRLLAYSSLSHVGYMLLGLGIALYAQDASGAQGSFFHMLNHGLMKGLAFLAAGAFLYALHVASGDHSPLLISDLSGAAKSYPMMALGLSLAVLSLGGLPPFAGFMSKWQIFAAGFETHNGWIQALVIFAALNSVLSLAYYAPLVNTLYRQSASPLVQHGHPLSIWICIPVMILTASVIAVGIWPGLFNWLSDPAGSALLAAFGLGG
ncbi:MAG: NADH dehydrogenase [Chloroflexi bacterium]|nr:NADH dehydrogenase [Chloroflexota bacterium]